MASVVDKPEPAVMHVNKNLGKTTLKEENMSIVTLHAIQRRIVIIWLAILQTGRIGRSLDMVSKITSKVQ